MIAVSDIQYQEDTNITTFVVTFTHEDYQQIHNAGSDGNLTEQQIIEMFSIEHDQWLERINQ